MNNSLNKNIALPEELFRGQGALKAEDLGNANATVITVDDVDSMDFDDEDAPNGTRTVIILKSREYDKGFFLNKSGLRTVVEQYGDIPARWVGKRIPLVKVRVNNPKTHKQQESLQVAAADEWDKITGAGTRSSRSSNGRKSSRGKAKKTAKRRGR